MAQNQATGGNSMAATLGNLQQRQKRNPPGAPMANFGAGMQPNMAPGRGPAQQAGQVSQAGQGYPQMSPAAMQNIMGQQSQAQQQPLGQGWGAAQAPGQQLQGGAPGN